MYNFQLRCLTHLKSGYIAIHSFLNNFSRHNYTDHYNHVSIILRFSLRQYQVFKTNVGVASFLTRTTAPFTPRQAIISKTCMSNYNQIFYSILRFPIFHNSQIDEKRFKNHLKTRHTWAVQLCSRRTIIS